VEEILDETTEISLTRQKNTIRGKWYGITLLKAQISIADNGTWIEEVITLKKTKKEFKEEIGSNYTKGLYKSVQKVIKEAIELGWFKSVK
jgi:hypothetical protein